MGENFRIKVIANNESVFWTLVNTKECVKISDLCNKIKHLSGDKEITTLWLDNCLLPNTESCLLLRDNDTVTTLQPNNSNPGRGCVSSVFDDSNALTFQKQKRKHDKIDDNSRSDEEARQSFSVVDHPLSASHSNNEYKEDGDVAGLKCSNGVNGVPSEKSLAPDNYRFLSKKKKQKKKHDIKYNNDDHDTSSRAITVMSKHDAPEPTSKQDMPILSQTHDSIFQKCNTGISEYSGSVSQKKTDEVCNTVCPESCSTHCEAIAASVTIASNVNVVSKRKRARRKHKKKSTDVDIDTSSQQISKEHGSGVVSIRLPFKKQPQGRRTVFNSGDDGDYDRSESIADESPPHHIPSSTNSSIIAAVQAHSGELFNGDCMESDPQVSSTPKELTMMGRSEKCVDEGEIDLQLIACHNESTSYQSYVPDFKFKDVHCPNPQELIDHLVMSPEERGVSLPNYMTARRLPNGAMLYKRNPLALQNPALYHEGHVHNETVSQSPNEACYQDKLGNKSTDAPHMPAQVVIQDYSPLPDLSTLPKIGDRIAFKELEMNENYTPMMSDYKEGLVAACDPGGQIVILKMLKDTSIKHLPGRFDLQDVEEEEIAETVEKDLSALFQPKLMSPLCQ